MSRPCQNPHLEVETKRWNSCFGLTILTTILKWATGPSGCPGGPPDLLAVETQTSNPAVSIPGRSHRNPNRRRQLRMFRMVVRERRCPNFPVISGLFGSLGLSLRLSGQSTPTMLAATVTVFAKRFLGKHPLRLATRRHHLSLPHPKLKSVTRMAHKHRSRSLQ